MPRPPKASSRRTKREDELATRREQLTLQLAILSEQKAAKIISLLEELRQDYLLTLKTAYYCLRGPSQSGIYGLKIIIAFLTSLGGEAKGVAFGASTACRGRIRKLKQKPPA